MARIHKSDIRKNHDYAVRRWKNYFDEHPIDAPSTEFDITLIGTEGEETHVLTTDLTHKDLCCGLDDIMALSRLHKMYVVGTKLREVRNGYWRYEEFRLWEEFHGLASEVADFIAGSGFVSTRGLYLS